jgi:small subunit ribosomal protein S18
MSETPNIETPAAPPQQVEAVHGQGQGAPYQGQQSGMGMGRKPGGSKRFPRRKVCIFCADKIDYVDYKDAKRLRKFVTERGKLVPRRISGNCAAHQRMLTVAVKRARVIALLPFKAAD